MTMTLAQGIITVAAVVLGTVITRFLPFVLFPANNRRPNLSSTLAGCCPAPSSGCWWFTA